MKIKYLICALMLVPFAVRAEDSALNKLTSVVESDTIAIARDAVIRAFCNRTQLYMKEKQVPDINPMEIYEDTKYPNSFLSFQCSSNNIVIVYDVTLLATYYLQKKHNINNVFNENLPGDAARADAYICRKMQIGITTAGEYKCLCKDTNQECSTATIKDICDVNGWPPVNTWSQNKRNMCIQYGIISN